MSAEILESLYLRCDGVSFGGHRCTIRFGFEGRAPVDISALEGLAHNARTKGWQIEIRNEGLKGWSASSFCPGHIAAAPVPTQETKP